MDHQEEKRLDQNIKNQEKQNGILQNQIQALVQTEENLMETTFQESFDFRNWILEQHHRGYELHQENPDFYVLETPYGRTEIKFYLGDIAEMSIIRKRDEELRYYLHFQILDKDHAITLYREMEDILLSLKEEHTLHVLLSCTSGATTGFLAEKLNEAAQLMGLDYEFDATSYFLIYEKAEKADIILIAPQIRYLQKKLEIAIPNKPIIPIPTKMFTSNNVIDLLDFITKTVKERQQEKLEEEEKQANALSSCPSCPSLEDYVVLQIMMLFDYDQMKLRMRLRDHGKLILDETSLHHKVTMAGLRGEVEYCLSGVEHCDLISIAMPGEISGDNVEFGRFSKVRIKGKQLRTTLEETFHTQCFLVNGVNAACYGFAKLHPEYKNIVMLSQPYGAIAGGIGTVINGHLVTGKEGIAGENRYFLERMQFSGPLKQLAKTEQGQMEIVTANMLPTIALLGPDVFVLRTPMVSNMEEVHNHLKMYFPERLLPELVFIEDVSELVFTGLRELAQKFLKTKIKLADKIEEV